MNCFGLSDTGIKRKTNQDSFCIKKYGGDITLCVVCDGMGGANGGQIASAMAVEVFTSHIEKVLRAVASSDSLTLTSDLIQRALLQAAQRANTAIFEKSSGENELEGMGTTLVAALITDSKIYCINIGDSRLYTVNNDGITQITKDHSYVQYLIDEGLLKPDEAAGHPNKNIITRAVGTHDYTEADTFILDRQYSYLLLCTDGLTNYVDNDSIYEILTCKGTLENKVTKLIANANKNGGGDNITATVISFSESDKENESE